MSLKNSCHVVIYIRPYTLSSLTQKMFGCFSSKTISNAISTVELEVHMDCAGCEKRIRKTISRLEGVDSVDIDIEKQKVTVTGYVDRGKVLKAVRSTGRKAEYWPYPYDEEYHPYASEYLGDDTFFSTHNYDRHGYNHITQGYMPDFPHSTIIHDQTEALFNDDNVHACIIM